MRVRVGRMSTIDARQYAALSEVARLVASGAAGTRSALATATGMWTP
jgi:hypothetical protein